MVFASTPTRSMPLPLQVALIVLGIFTLTRLGLTAYSGLESVPFSLWPVIFAKGLWFDSAVIALLLAPVCLYEAALPKHWRHSRGHRLLRLLWLWSAVALLLFAAVAEATFWLEFSTRFNFIAVDYLLYTHEVLGNIRESYPIGWILLGIAVLAAAVVWLLRDWITQAELRTAAPAERRWLVATALVLPAFSVAFANVDQMQGQNNAYAEELSGNGMFTFAASLRRNELDYETFYKTIPQQTADATLQQLRVQRQPLSAAPVHVRDTIVAAEVTPFSRRPRNVVMITVESLSASFLGAYGAHTGLTPNLDQLARDGLQFDNLFATGTRTVRGLEAVSLGIPPIPGQSVLHRPRNEHLATVGELLQQQGMSALFIYGGYGYFDNMNAYFSGNDYQVVDRTDFPQVSVPFENIWGVADEALFSNSLVELDRVSAQGKPFFAHIMTTSNHRPYSYPDGRIDIPSPGGRAGAVKYTDYAIGKFIAEAKSKPWFDDTLFVILADHCASVAGKSKLPVEKYHIPLIFYAPALLQSGHYRPIVSQADLPPTLLGILGKQGGENFFGRSFFAQGLPLQRAFISNYQNLGYLKDGVLTVLLPKQGVESFRIDPVSYAATPTAVDPRLLQEAIAYYQSASRAFKTGALHMSASKLNVAGRPVESPSLVR